MFMRLTYRSITDAPIRRIPAGMVTSTSSFGRSVPPCICSGALSSEYGTALVPTFQQSKSGDRAPDRPVPTSSSSTTTSVDTAGWTEVVIQREPLVLSDVIIGYSLAEVNASINYVSGAADGGLWLDQSGGSEFFGDTDECRGYAVMNGSSFSCSNNNEVTI